MLINEMRVPKDCIEWCNRTVEHEVFLVLSNISLFRLSVIERKDAVEVVRDVCGSAKWYDERRHPSGEQRS